MGCTSSRKISDFPRSGSLKAEQEKVNSTNNLSSNNVNDALISASPADEARSFRSKVGAMKIMMRTSHSYESLLQFLQEKSRAEYLICYKDMNEIKMLDDDQMISRTAALIWRYKTSYEAVRILGAPAETMEYLIWECFGKLRQLDIANAPAETVKKYLVIAQNEIIARLVIPFEEYLNSPKYREWQDEQLELEKQRRNSRQVSNNNIPSPKTLMVTSSPSLISISIAPKGPAILGADYPDVLVVDDSLVTLKLTGLTLERDGHHVDRAANGQIALQLMKSRSYDVVLIDCNMPVMDGFEAVALFREHERQVAQAGEHEFLFPTSEDRLSSISGSDEDDDEDLNNKSKQDNTTATKKTQSHSNRGSGHHHNHNQNNNKQHPEGMYATSSSKDENNFDSSKSFLAALPGEQEQQLRRKLTEAHYHQLIIGMSTNIDEETRDRALAAGMDFFLPKPFTLEKFLDTLRLSREQRLQRSQQQMEQQQQQQVDDFHLQKGKTQSSIIRASMGEGTVQSAVMSMDSKN